MTEHEPPGATAGQADGAPSRAGAAAGASGRMAEGGSQLPSPAPSGMSRLVSGLSNLSRVASGVSATSIQRQISARAPLDIEKLGDGEVVWQPPLRCAAPAPAARSLPCHPCRSAANIVG